MVHLWRRALDASPAEVNSCQGLLSKEEKERALRFRIEGPRKAFVLTRGTLRLLLAGYLGGTSQHVRLGHARNGKHSSKASTTCASTSHTPTVLSLMALARRRAIGVDREFGA
jgi:4'-phosphopantetheinyl transferase